MREHQGSMLFVTYILLHGRMVNHLLSIEIHYSSSTMDGEAQVQPPAFGGSQSLHRGGREGISHGFVYTGANLTYLLAGRLRLFFLRVITILVHNIFEHVIMLHSLY